MKWRYQPVWADFQGERTYSLVEVYLDDDGKLDCWTAEPAVEVALGNDQEDLIAELTHMAEDARKWKPVDWADLKVGMTFERAQ